MIGIAISGQTKEIRGFYVSYVANLFFFDIGMVQDVTTKDCQTDTIVDKVLFYEKKKRRIHLVGPQKQGGRFYTYDRIY